MGGEPESWVAGPHVFPLHVSPFLQFPFSPHVTVIPQVMKVPQS
jgi:hypothetical protein